MSKNKKCLLLGLSMALFVVIGYLSFAQVGRMTKDEMADFGASVDQIAQTADTQSAQAWLSLPFMGVGIVCLVMFFYALFALKDASLQKN